jgi:AAHS family 4-hydroxybenzoate transporter-like MFS transporter
MTTPSRVDIGQLLDAARWSGYSKWLVSLVALTVVFDGIDNQLLGIVIPTIMAEWGAARSAFAPVVSLGYLGMMIGGAVAGFAGDRFGRRTALLSSVVVFGVTTLGAAMVHDIASLGVLRLLAGLGLGGAMPNAAALAAEYVPRRQRAFAVTLTIVCVPLGGTFAGLLGIRMLPIVGWRTLFVLGGIIPVVAALVLRFVMPESPRFLARHPARWKELAAVLRRMGHHLDDDVAFEDKAEESTAKVSIASLFTPEFRRDTLALWAAFFCCLLSVYLGFSWLTALLTGAGFATSVASSGITVFNLGGVFGALVGGVAIGRFGSRISMLLMSAAAVAGAALLSLMEIAPAANVGQLLLLLTLTGASINGVQTTMYALAAHVYPSVVRASGVGSAVAFGRSGAILVGYLGPWTIALGGTTAFFAAVATMMTATLVALACVRRHVPAHSTGRIDE